MSNLTRVREALESLRRVAPTQDYEDDAEVALNDLTAHEQELAELVMLMRNIMHDTNRGTSGRIIIDAKDEALLYAALRPFEVTI